jgi:hypothetical protein
MVMKSFKIIMISAFGEIPGQLVRGITAEGPDKLNLRRRIYHGYEVLKTDRSVPGSAPCQVA